MLTLYCRMATLYYLLLSLYYRMLTIVTFLLPGVGLRPDVHLRPRDRHVTALRLTLYYMMMTLYYRMMTIYYYWIMTFFLWQGLDLDLTYICDRVVTMSLPCDWLFNAGC